MALSELLGFWGRSADRKRGKARGGDGLVLHALDDAVVRRSHQKRQHPREMTASDDVLCHIRVARVDRRSAFDEHELVRVILPLEQVEDLADFSLPVDVSTFTRQREQQVEVAIRSLEVDSDVHAYVVPVSTGADQLTCALRESTDEPPIRQFGFTCRAQCGMGEPNRMRLPSGSTCWPSRLP